MTTWVVNASPLILLGKIGRLDFLATICPAFEIPAAVAAEPAQDPALEWLRSGIGREHIKDDAAAQLRVLVWDLGPGETAVIARAIECQGSVAVLDDLAARTCAVVYRIPVIGTLGILLKAKEMSLIAALKPEIEKLIEVGSQLHPAVVQKALQLAGETVLESDQ